MDRLLYISTIGAAHIERAQTLHAHNLANVSTTGFRADFAQAQSRWVDTPDGYPARVYGITESPGTDHSQGMLRATGRDLDVAVEGSGFLAVQLPDGSEGYTRAGDLGVDSLGRLVSGEGFPVLGEGGPIALPPFTQIFIGGDGGITVQPEGQGPEALVQVDRLKLVDPDPSEVAKDATGLFRRTDGVPAPADPDVKVVSGFLEDSNVNAVNELTEIISLARQFELEVRMMQMAETMDESATTLVRVS
ncbi:MAG: flagellar basal body rod protein FlgF [Pseudomonadales bacterium]